jgi:hypothetical protein
MSMNGDGKTTSWRIIDVALILVIGLVSALWAATWSNTDKVACEAKQVALKASEEVHLTKEFIAEQRERNKNTDEKLDAILREIRRNK